MPSKEAKMDHFLRKSSTWSPYAFLLLAIVAVVEIEGDSRYLSNRPPANYQNNAVHHLRQHQLAIAAQKQANSTSTKPETHSSNPINCVKGGAKRYPDSKDESRFHMCTFSTSHRIWMVYSFNCPKLSIFDAKSEKCATRASVLNPPSKRIPWDQRIQQNLHHKNPPASPPNSKVRPTAVTFEIKVGNNSKSNNSSSPTSKPAVTSTTSTTERIPASSTVAYRIPIRNSVPGQNNKNQHLIRYPNLLQRLTTTAAPPKRNTFNRIRPGTGNVTPVNRRYTTTPPSRTRPRRPPPTARTTTVKPTTTTMSTTTTEKAMEASEPVDNLNPELHSSFGAGDAPDPDPDPVDRTKVTGSGSNSNAGSNIGVIRTVAGKIAYLAQAIESLLTAFEGSVGYQKPCVDAAGAGSLNGNSISKIDAQIEGFEASEAGVKVPVPASTEAPPSLISPSDLKNILDFFTVGNPVNKEIANKVMGTAGGSGQTTETSTAEQTENDPESQSPPPQSPAPVQAESEISSEEDQVSGDDTVLRLPPKLKEPMLTDEDTDAPGPGPPHSASSFPRPNSSESENQIQQSDQNVKEEEGDPDDASEWNVIVTKPTEAGTSGVEDSALSSVDKLQIDADSSDVQPLNEKDSSNTFPTPTRTRFPGAPPPPQLQHAPASSRTRDTSPVSVEQADILKIGGKGSNRRPRSVTKVAQTGEEESYLTTAR